MVAVAPMTLPEVRAEWGWLRNGLLTVIERTRERWLPEDVWQSIMGQHAFAWRITKDADDIGFMVLRRDMDVDGPALFVWALWVEPDGLRDCYRELMAQIDDVARRIGAKRIRMESPREGWTWVKFFDPVRTIYERGV